MIARIDIQLPEGMKEEFYKNVKDEGSTFANKLRQLIYSYNIEQRRKRGKTNSNANTQ